MTLHWINGPVVRFANEDDASCYEWLFVSGLRMKWCCANGYMNGFTWRR